MIAYRRRVPVSPQAANAAIRQLIAAKGISAMTDSDRLAALLEHIAAAIALADELGLAHLRFLLAMAVIEANDRA